MFHLKHFAFFSLFFSLISGCKLFFNDNIQQKSSQLLDNVNSIILNASEKKDSQQNIQNITSTNENTSENKTQQKQLPKAIKKAQEQNITRPKLRLSRPIPGGADVDVEEDPDGSIEAELEEEVFEEQVEREDFEEQEVEDELRDLDQNTNQNGATKTLKQQQTNIILKGYSSNTSLKGLNSESTNIPYNHTYNSHYDSKPTIISGSSYTDNYSSLTTIQEDEFEEDEDKDSKLETRLDNLYKFKLKNTLNSVEQAITLAEQIKDDLDTIEFHKIKLSNQGRRAEEHEKQNSIKELSRFSKNKLEANLKELLSEIGKSLYVTTILITNNELGGILQSDLSAKTKLDELKIEVNSCLLYTS
ncbi:hypothetical protein KZ832_30795, partial [Pseudomonas aeruginosa]|nr:hypothetical protein [Pseudomonas aeruginosa]